MAQTVLVCWHSRSSIRQGDVVGLRESHLIATALALSALALPQAASADWPVYGHDLSNTRNAGRAGPPADRVTALKRAWTFDSPTGDFTGTPVVAGGVVVAGDYGGHVYALDAVSGQGLWAKDAGAPV